MSNRLLLSAHWFLLVLSVASPALADDWQRNINWNISKEQQERVAASTSQWRFRCSVTNWKIRWAGKTLSAACWDDAKVGQLFYLVDTRPIGGKYQVPGVVQLTNVSGDGSPATIDFSILQGFNKQALFQAAERGDLKIMAAESLQLFAEHKQRTQNGAFFAAGNLWLGLLHGLDNYDTLYGVLYGVSLSGQYKSTSLSADLLLDFVQREIQEQSGVNETLYDASLYLRGKLQQMFAEDFAARATAMYGRFFGEQERESNWFIGDLILGYRYGDRIIMGLGYRYIGLSLNEQQLEKKYQQHFLAIGLWEASMIGYGKQYQLDWGLDLIMYVGASSAENGPDNMFAGGVEGLLYGYYITKYFIVRLGYRAFLDISTVPEKDQQQYGNYDLRYVLHGPFLDMGLFVGF